MATGQTRIAVGTAGVKGVRIGMDGQAHPTTRIVVDLEKACAYELTPGPAGKLVLTLHANAVAKANAEAKTVAATTPAPASKPMSPFSPRVMDAQVCAESGDHARCEANSQGFAYGLCIVEPTYQAKSRATKAMLRQRRESPTSRRFAPRKPLHASPTRLPRNCFR